MDAAHIPTLIVTGPVGIGKTTIANAVSELLQSLDKPHALVDMDSLRQCFPNPPDDPFQTALGFRNLAAIWTNCHAMGAERLILADVVETRAVRASFEQAIPGAALQIVRLDASLPTILRRLEGRETAASLTWYRQRAHELSVLMNENRVEDMLIDTEDKTIDQIAQEILTRLSWDD